MVNEAEVPTYFSYAEYWALRDALDTVQRQGIIEDQTAWDHAYDKIIATMNTMETDD